MTDNFEYADRKKLDEKLYEAIDDILSAEKTAKGMIADAEETVKALKQSAAEKERAMRAQFVTDSAKRKDDAIASAVARADDACERSKRQAFERGEKLFESKKAEIQRLADELFASIGGKA